MINQIKFAARGIKSDIAIHNKLFAKVSFYEQIGQFFIYKIVIPNSESRFKTHMRVFCFKTCNCYVRYKDIAMSDIRTLR